MHSVLCERTLLLECGGFDESLPVLEDWDLWLRVFGAHPPTHVRRVVCEVRTRLWPLTLAPIYGKTLQRARTVPGLRAARPRHLLRDAQTWLAGGDGLGAIDPDDALRFLKT